MRRGLLLSRLLLLFGHGAQGTGGGDPPATPTFPDNSTAASEYLIFF